MKYTDVLVTLILPFEKSLTNVDLEYIQEAHKKLKNNFEQFELIVVSSLFDEKTELASLIKALDGVRLLSLTKNYEFEILMSAGVESSIGDFVAIAKSQLDPIADIINILKQSISSQKIILGTRKSDNSDSKLIQFGRKIFFKVVKSILNVNIPQKTTYLCALPRKAVTHIIRTKDRFRFIKTMSAQIGLPFELYLYQFNEPYRKIPFRTLSQSLKYSLDLLFSSSTKPLRWITVFCGAGIFLTILYTLYVLIFYFSSANVEKGWASISLIICVFFFIVFSILAIFSEYLGIIVEEVKDRPLYYISEEIAGRNAVINAEKLNVLTETLNLHEE